jgi:hypothetical protein
MVMTSALIKTEFNMSLIIWSNEWDVTICDDLYQESDAGGDKSVSCVRRTTTGLFLSAGVPLRGY